MRYHKIMIFFSIAIVFSTIMRFFQINNTIEFETGFFKTGYEARGYFILAAIFAVALICAVFGKLAHRRPEHPSENNKVLGVISFIPAISIAYEVFFTTPLIITNVAQILLLKITGLFTAAFFIAFGIRKFVYFKMHGILTVIPCIYVIMRIIFDFTSISSLALISDNIFLIGAYFLILLFMLNFAKLYNNIDTNTNFRKLLSTGTSASILCISQSIPYLIINYTSNNSYNHITPSENFSVLSLGIFIIAFILSHFSIKNVE